MSFRNFISDKLFMPLLLRFTQSPPWPWYEELLRLDRADLGEIQKIQWDKFQSFVDYSQRTVPYYSETFGRAGVCADDLSTWDDLLALPTIDKHQIAANFPDRITSAKSDRDTWQYYATSGTTDRLMVVKDSETTSRNIALALYELQMQGTYTPGSLQVNIPPDACSLACAAATKRPQGTIDRTKQAIVSLTKNGLSGIPRSLGGRILRSVTNPSKEMPSFGTQGTRVDSDLLQWYIDSIQQWRPALLSGLPEYLQMLARHIERSQQPPPPIAGLLPQGSLTTATVKNELTRAFGVPVHEVYGGHEFGCIASTCELSDKLHVLMSECLVETVRNGKHAAPGELGEIVITSFINRTMPLIRYRPGDVGRLHEDYCSCGRRTQMLTLEGRLQDTIVTSRGIRTSEQIMNHILGWPNIEFAQLVQRSEARCDLLVVEKERGRTRLSDLGDSVSDFLGGDLQIRPRLVSTIKPEASGKFRFVKSLSYERFHESKPIPFPAETRGGFTDRTLQSQTEGG
ncbi:phenylacetate--CoA ligase family protein [Thermodesulfobacteriota bacterium]